MTSSTQDTPHINPPNPKKRKICERRSWVWDYFNYIEGATQFTCIRCSSVVQIFGSSTTELIRHLKESHQITQQSSLDLVLASTPDINFIDEESEDEIENNNEDSILSEKKRIKINNAVMRFIAQNNLPFIIVESDSFKYLLSLLNSKYKLPCRENFRNKILPKMYEDTKKQVITKLNTLDLGSMTTDCWTSNSTMSYLSLTVHFINEQFYFQSLTLNLHYLQSEHTANYLHASLEELLQSWNLKDKMIGGVADSGANMSAALSKFDDEFISLPCAAHRLNLSVNELFSQKNIKSKEVNGVKKHFIRRIIEVDGVCRDEEIDDVEVSTIEIFNTIHEHTIQPVLEKCRKLVGKFKHSESLQRKLSEKQLSTNQEFKIKLKQEVKTRWNSTFDMLESIIINKNILQTIHNENMHTKHDINILSAMEFNTIEQLCKLLSPLKEITEYLSGSTYVTNSIVFPAFYFLVKKNLPEMSFDNRQIECLRDELMAIIKRRFRHVLNNSVNDYFLSAAYLDIAYRDFKFIDDLEERDLALTKAKDYLINLNEKFSIFVNKDVAPVPVQQVTSQNQFVTPVANNINTTQNTTRTNGSAASLSSNGSATSLSSNGSAASLNSNGSAGNSGNPTINKSTYTPTVTKRRLHSGFLSQILPKQSNDVQRSTLEHEFAQYESISFIISEESAHKFQQRTLSFFKTHKSDLPKLSNLARIILAIPATSVPSESLFSVAGMIQTELRNRLNPACLEMLNFIRSNQNEKFYKKK